ncbi:MAG TPA: hypothetical protein VGI99_12115 [Gemmataceae bacterium]
MAARPAAPRPSFGWGRAAAETLDRARFIETQLLEYLKLLDERLKGTIAELD